MFEKQLSKEEKKKLKYPKSVFFIISNEFCERFSYYGMRTILALYLAKSLGYSEDMSTVIYHVFVMLCYFTPVLGGIMADSWLGKYRTILYVSIIYAIGNVVLAVGSVETLPISHRWMSMIGLLLIALGTGGIKPCVSSFGGDQFVLPEQEKQLQSFFSVFYFTINAGSVLSCFFTPMLREDISCLGQDTCNPLAFGVPAILMIASIIFFVAGKFMYKMKDPEGNIVALVTKCIWHAIVRKIKQKKVVKKDHWLDYADDKYDKKLIGETKIFLDLALLFSPTIVFWALYEQQGSRWTFQASHMNGYTWGYNIDPDQIQTLNPVLVLIFIPIFDKWLYPLLAKIRLIRTPLQKLSWGGLLGALAFLISGLLELSVQDSYAVLPASGESILRVYNTLPCAIDLKSDVFQGNIKEISMYQNFHISVSGKKNFLVNIAGSCVQKNMTAQSMTVYEKEISSYLIKENIKNNETLLLELNLKGSDEVEKSNTTKINPKIKVVSGIGGSNLELIQNGKVKKSISIKDYQSSMHDDFTFGEYNLKLDGTAIGKPVFLNTGGVYTILLGQTNKDTKATKVITVTNANTVHMFWQVPQYFVISVAEIMFSITGMEFSFTESPDSMKSVISSLWLITDGFGNVIILIIAGVNIFDNKAYELFLYAVLMVAVMIIFIYLAIKYKYVKKEPEISQQPPNNRIYDNTQSTLEYNSTMVQDYNGKRVQ